VGERRPEQQSIKVIIGPFLLLLIQPDHFDRRRPSLSIWNWAGEGICGHAEHRILANIFTAVYVTRWIFGFLDP